MPHLRKCFSFLRHQTCVFGFSLISVSSEIAFLFLHLKWKKWVSDWPQEILSMWCFFRVSGKTAHWMKVTSGLSKLTSFVSISTLKCHEYRNRWCMAMAKEFFFPCWTFSVRLVTFSESLAHVDASFLHKPCIKAGCISKGHYGCNIILW